MSIERRINERKASQKSKVLFDLVEGKGITPIDALNDYGCFRLAAVIHQLRSEGHQIKTTMIEDEDKRYAKYALDKSNISLSDTPIYNF
tara:strand:- start:114 stop:380 length:267 start_codon:yes stop_codon:yes gene_type:complete